MISIVLIPLYSGNRMRDPCTMSPAIQYMTFFSSRRTWLMYPDNSDRATDKVTLFAAHLREEISVHVVAVKNSEPLRDAHGDPLWR